MLMTLGLWADTLPGKLLMLDCGVTIFARTSRLMLMMLGLWGEKRLGGGPS